MTMKAAGLVCFKKIVGYEESQSQPVALTEQARFIKNLGILLSTEER